MYIAYQNPMRVPLSLSVLFLGPIIRVRWVDYTFLSFLTSESYTTLGVTPSKTGKSNRN
jgi:hypothetical protein